MEFTRKIRQAIKILVPDSLLLRRRVRRALLRERELTAVLKLSNGHIFVDVGANEGTWSSAAAPTFHQVHAFEPYPALAKKIRGFLPANVTVHNVALSDHEGTATLYVPVIDGLQTISRASLESDANGTAQSIPQSVPLRTLDSYDLAGVDVIKIDVEGHEAAALRGAEKTLARERPSIVVEIEERHHEGGSEAIIARLCEQAYDCFYLTESGVTQFKAGDIARLQPHRQSRLGGGQESYVNNFIFLPIERPDLRDRLGHTAGR